MVGKSPNAGSTANVLGMLTGQIVGDLGAAVAVVGALWCGFSALNETHIPSLSERWKYYLIAGGIFVAVLAACRWRGNA